jgi:hypothetical protein
MGWREAAVEAGEHVPSSVVDAGAVEGMMVDETRMRGRRSTSRSSLLLLVSVFTLLMGMARAGINSRSSLVELSPFQVLGEWLDRSDDSDLKGAGSRDIERAFKV